MKLEAFTDTHGHILKSWFDKDDASNNFISYYAKPEQWLSLVNGVSRIGYAATVGGRMVGFVDLELDNKNGASFAFGIDPSLRNQGFGSRLVSEIEKIAHEHGATTLYAGVEKDNIASRRVLDKAAYNTVPTEDGTIGYIKEIG